MRRGTVIALGCLVILAGCGGPGGGTPEPITAGASKATVAGGALEETGYEEVRVDQQPFNDTGRITVQGDVEFDVEYRLDGTAWSAAYHGPGSPPPVVAAFSVPQVRPEQVAVAVNPLADRSPADIPTRAQGRYEDIRDIRLVENRTITFLGNETALAEYAATATVDGQSIDVVLQLVTVRHRSDVVAGVAVYPEGAGEKASVVTLLEAVEH